MSREKSHEVALRSRTDLSKYGDNARLLFALQVKFRLEDIHSIAAECLTDGSDDKKCDLIYVDKDEGFAVIAQSYESRQQNSRTAPSNKASDLNTAASWLLTQTDELPERLKPAAQELHSALEAQNIKSIYFWYVHNLTESDNVARELRVVESTASALLNKHFSDSEVENIHAIEVGWETLEEWYKASLTPILVTTKFEIPLSGGYEISGQDWKAYVTSIHASWLYEIYRKYGRKLFSANVRDYLGSRRSDTNINHGIKSTAEKDPGRFWAFNNGLTGLVSNYDYEISEENVIVLKIKGLSIVNGAQTTGAIGALRTPPSEEVMVSIRFVKCNNQDTIQNIIQYNNSQNKIAAADFRSNDPVQRRLRDEFNRIPNAKYLGGRRGGEQDSISRPQNLIPSNTAAQALMAFHQEPVIAYNKKSEIWSSDRRYSKIFNEETHAEHIVFVYSLLRCIENKKFKLREIEQSGVKLTEAQKEQLGFLRNRGATFLFMAAIAKCLETFINRAIPNIFLVSFGADVSPSEATDFWAPIIEATIPFCSFLTDAIQNGLKSTERVLNQTAMFKKMVDATKTANSEIYSEFSKHIHIN